MSAFPLHRFCEFMTLTPQEVAALEGLCGPTMVLDDHQVLRREGDEVNELYLLLEGWMISSIALPDGRRQIVKVYLPGDLAGVPSLALTRAGATLTTVTPARVSIVLLKDFGRLFAVAPRIAANLFLGAQLERVMLMDRVASVGRTSSVQRLAAFLLHIHDRLQLAADQPVHSFELPLMQAEIADALGITAVHMSRTFRELDRTQMVKRSGRRIVLLDLEGLRDFAALPRRHVARQPDWIPSGDLANA